MHQKYINTFKQSLDIQLSLQVLNIQKLRLQNSNICSQLIF